MCRLRFECPKRKNASSSINTSVLRCTDRQFKKQKKLLHWTHVRPRISQIPACFSIRTLSEWEGWVKSLGSSQSVSCSRWCVINKEGFPLKSGTPYLVTPIGLLWLPPFTFHSPHLLQSTQQSPSLNCTQNKHTGPTHTHNQQINPSRCCWKQILPTGVSSFRTILLQVSRAGFRLALPL